MLVALRIENLAIIDELTISLHPGFNVLTGETGVGKSIVVNALNLLLGGKPPEGLLRTGAEEGSVEALFDLSESPLREKVGEEVLLKRVISSKGRGRALINGELATLQGLSSLAEGLLDIYGQQQHYLLRRPEQHLELLDQFGALLPLRRRYQDLFAQLRKIMGELAELERRRAEAEQRRDFLTYQVRELEEASLDPEEEERLLQERQLLAKRQQVLEVLEGVEASLYSGEGSIIEGLAGAVAALGRIASLDEAFSRWRSSLEEVRLLLEELCRDMKGYASRLDHDPGRLEEMEARLALIGRLKRKHGTKDVEGLLEVLKGLKAELRSAEDLGGAISEGRKRLREVEGELRELAIRLSEGRAEAAEALQRAMEEELKGLGMPEARFIVALKPVGKEALQVGDISLGPRGAEEGEFLFSANPGEEPKPLASIASGGELSRVMLALKGVSSRQREGQTLVFDEIDAGIGGVAAETVGQRLRELAQFHQVICVTHLPQIASQAHHHLRVRKFVREGRTVTAVEPLHGEERKREIARMFAGTKVTEATLKHVEQMLKGAGERR